MPPDESFASDVDDLKNYTAIDSSSCITVDYKMKKKIVQYNATKQKIHSSK